MLPMLNYGCTKAAAQERSIALLLAAGLTPQHAEKFPHQLSGGECQRAAIARAISIKPRLLICDEITSALDVQTQAEIIQLLLKLQAETKNEPAVHQSRHYSCTGNLPADPDHAVRDDH